MYLGLMNNVLAPIFVWIMIWRVHYFKKSNKKHITKKRKQKFYKSACVEITIVDIRGMLLQTFYFICMHLNLAININSKYEYKQRERG